MNKNTLKKIILAINESCLETTCIEDLIPMVQQRTQESKRTILSVLHVLEKYHAIEWIEDEIDFFPSAIIFARSKNNSIPEILAFWEMLGRSDDELFHYGISINDKSVYKYMDLIKQEDSQKILSDTLSILYTDSIIHKSPSIPYKNEHHPIVELECKDFLLKEIPKRGIPTNRDVSKELQVHFKDTLMHEFDRKCAICGIHLPRMLIGSHIKPFRDCGHIFEAADHNNGLLLCRNHDFLFDQGYITYDSDGTLIVSKHLKKPSSFHLHDLNQNWMTNNRKLYMEYHRNFIFRDEICHKNKGEII